MTYRPWRATGGVAFCAAPAAVPMGMVKEPRRERPRLGAALRPPRPPGVAHASVPGEGEGVIIGGAVRPENARLCAARFFMTSRRSA
jgi:hypothetical protein